MYEEIRRNRASAIQVLSNAGQDEAHKVMEEASKFIPKDQVPCKQGNLPLFSPLVLSPSISSPNRGITR